MYITNKSAKLYFCFNMLGVLKIRFILLLVLITSLFACDFIPGVEYICIPCGGIYECHGTGVCVANAGDVPGCTLPSRADDWYCCDAATCNLSANNECSYTAPVSPRPSPPPTNTGGDGSGSNSGSSTLIIILVVFGTVAGIAAIIFLAFVIIKKKQKNTTYPPLNNP